MCEEILGLSDKDDDDDSNDIQQVEWFRRITAQVLVGMEHMLRLFFQDIILLLSLNIG